MRVADLLQLWLVWVLYNHNHHSNGWALVVIWVVKAPSRADADSTEH